MAKAGLQEAVPEVWEAGGPLRTPRQLEAWRRECCGVEESGTDCKGWSGRILHPVSLQSGLEAQEKSQSQRQLSGQQLLG